MTHDAHVHDLGFSHDLPRLIGRRRMLGILGALGLAGAAGPAAALDCVALPWETAGPYPADGSNARSGQVVNALTEAGVVREDIRGSFNGRNGVAEGVDLTLELSLVDAAGCGPLAGHAIYVWHCDAEGRYSLYDLAEENFLRGVGIADGSGAVRFRTIVPGCYDGRWPHIHFEVFRSAEAAVSGEASVLTAQMALPKDVSAAVYAGDVRYEDGTRNLGRISIARDNVFGDNSAAEIAQQTLVMRGSVAEGFAGTLTIPVDFTAERRVMAPPPGGPKPQRAGD
ncbi:hypothetical protein GCM10011360_09880 [Primorskyibacter flagellatus]|uniref:Intradiol ring-cleavage dioxygenases domain-containing protein n=1 Tax=Primorskyibacter flagellatus TaxID=1387277 RepID=A0A917A4N9_9RHOB|nr:intradiol ring-cleavage dioxygenase [Primorskyibacter flagellatus]GGE23354.1 hypothetical protein GCM10011360_09880 [Primorskyibacter flagellatus]